MSRCVGAQRMPTAIQAFPSAKATEASSSPVLPDAPEKMCFASSGVFALASITRYLIPRALRALQTSSAFGTKPSMSAVRSLSDTSSGATSYRFPPT